MPYRHVLVPIDFSEVSDRVLGRALEVARLHGVLGRALEVARLHGARVTLLHIVDYLPPLGFADDFTPSPAILIDEDELVKRGSETLNRFAERYGLGPDSERVVQLGSAREAIVTVAAERGVDLIAIGSHGHRGLRRLLGTTADAVLNDATCDVLAIRVHA